MNKVIRYTAPQGARPHPKGELVHAINYDSAVAVLREIAKDDYDESGNAGLARDWLREHGEEV